jgi:hypothetical protein
VAYKPESVEALKELAKGYEAKGEPARALGAIEKAFKLVDGTNADEGDEFTAHINRLKSLIVRE